MSEVFEGAQMEMPRYTCHKQVWALRIASISPTGDGGAQFLPADDGYAPVYLTPQFMEKHKPEAGGYYVVYADGYKSFSPAAAFEDGYTRN